MRRDEALKVLELADSADGTAIRKQYLRLSKSRHPDKGGSKEAFQELVNAYEFLKSEAPKSAASKTPRPSSGKPTSNKAPEPNTDSESSDTDEEEYYADGFGYYGFHYEFHRKYDSSSWGEGEQEDDYFADFFERSREKAKKEYARQRRENVKMGYDYRDELATGGETCMFCGERTAITKEDAEDHGLNWKEYSAHPEGYRTCWACKNNQTSVMTECMATKKFAKKLDFTWEGPYGGEYRPVFWLLRKGEQSFHHQPQTTRANGPTRNSVFYWYPDLEQEALARGWKPRGKKKEEVPWTRKDRARKVPQTPNRRTKKRSTPVTPSPKRKRAKRRL